MSNEPLKCFHSGIFHTEIRKCVLSSNRFTVLLAGLNGRSAQVLLALTIPGHLVFIYTIYLIEGSETPPTPVFISLYLVAAFTQVSDIITVIFFLTLTVINMSHTSNCTFNMNDHIKYPFPDFI